MSEAQRPVEIGNVQYPVADVADAVQFYRNAFSIMPKFVDGQRYAALDAGGTLLALAGPGEDVTGGLPAASFKVPHVAAALEALIEAGGTVIREAQQGPHEVRAVAEDPWGNMLIVCGPR